MKSIGFHHVAVCLYFNCIDYLERGTKSMSPTEYELDAYEFTIITEFVPTNFRFNNTTILKLKLPTQTWNYF